MRVAVITTSRADYGIYRPLLLQLERDPYFDLHLVVLGSHLSKDHGFTIDEIISDGIEISFKVSHGYGDSPEEIVKVIGEITTQCARYWAREKGKSNLILCLGDRFEMHAAVYASVPFNIPVGHFHGGEVSLGAIDNIYRNSISVLANYHFCSTEQHARNVAAIKSSEINVHNVGSLSFDNLNHLSLLTPEEFTSRFGLKLDNQTILFTFHPETVDFECNEDFVRIICDTLKTMTASNFLITLPNADTNNSVIRKAFIELSESQEHIQCTENLGTLGYFTCLKHCKYVMGNSSSGIIEAAYFGKYALNIGNRQKGRQAGDNVMSCDIVYDNLVSCMEELNDKGDFEGESIYFKPSVTDNVIKILKAI